jgi:polyhydroxybutyrate depolymerase
MKIWSVVLFILMSAGAAVAQKAPAHPEARTWIIDGTVRRVLVYAPSKATRGKVPVVFGFHGGGDNIEHFSIAGFQDAWPEALVVYMQALERTPGRGDTGFQNADVSATNRDLKFFDTVLADLRQEFRVDDGRIFAAGFSNGARFVYLLWATRSKIFAAFAPVSSTLASTVELKEPKPFIYFGGRQEPNIRQQMESVEAAKKLNYATGQGERCGTACTLYRSPRGAPVITVVHDGAHFYPSFATDAIVSFFRSRP